MRFFLHSKIKFVSPRGHVISSIYYPTAPRGVQITPKMSTNITRYLYSRGPVRQVLSDICTPENLFYKFYCNSVFNLVTYIQQDVNGINFLINTIHWIYNLSQDDFRIFYSSESTSFWRASWRTSLDTRRNFRAFQTSLKFVFFVYNTISLRRICLVFLFGFSKWNQSLC